MNTKISHRESHTNRAAWTTDSWISVRFTIFFGNCYENFEFLTDLKFIKSNSVHPGQWREGGRRHSGRGRAFSNGCLVRWRVSASDQRIEFDGAASLLYRIWCKQTMPTEKHREGGCTAAANGCWRAKTSSIILMNDITDCPADSRCPGPRSGLVRVMPVVHRFFQLVPIERLGAVSSGNTGGLGGARPS